METNNTINNEERLVCHWLDSNMCGGIQLLGDKIYPCCTPKGTLIEEKNLDYDTLTTEEIKIARQNLYEAINKEEACKGCERLVKRPVKDIDLGKFKYFSVGLFSTCNLRCSYCYFKEEELKEKLTTKRNKLLPIVKKFSEGNMLKDNVELAVAGGEPTLFVDIYETLKFLEENYTNPSLFLISNSSIEQKTKKLAEQLRTIKGVNKKLYTSIDAGTAKTYKKIRGRNLFNTTCKNIVNYAKKDSFNTITLKYLLLFDYSNTSDKDIFGFMNLVKNVLINQKGITNITIDCDASKNSSVFDKNMIAAAGKIHYIATKIFNIEVWYNGVSITSQTKKGQKRIQEIEAFSKNYEKSKKSLRENLYLIKLHLSLKFNNLTKKIKKYVKFIQLIID